MVLLSWVSVLAKYEIQFIELAFIVSILNLISVSKITFFLGLNPLSIALFDYLFILLFVFIFKVILFLIFYFRLFASFLE